MAGFRHTHQIFPRAPAPSAARCPPRPPHWGSARPRSEKFPARCAKTAKETAAAPPHGLQIRALHPMTCLELYCTSSQPLVLDKQFKQFIASFRNFHTGAADQYPPMKAPRFLSTPPIYSSKTRTTTA